MSVDHGAVRGYDHKAGGGGNTLDLVKHVLLRDEANAIRWLRGQGLIDSPRHDRENAVGAAARRERVNRWRGRLRSQRMVDSCRQCRTLRTLARACIYDCGNAAYWERCRFSPQAPTSVPFASCSGEEARKEMADSIVAAPDAAPVIRGTGGIRKLRWVGSGRGKRGGIRAVFYQAGPDASGDDGTHRPRM